MQSAENQLPCLNPSMELEQASRTTPHIWRRVVMQSDSTLGQLHQTVQAFSDGPTRVHIDLFFAVVRFVAPPRPQLSSWLGAEVPLSEFRLLAKERFFFDYGFDRANVQLWRHQIRLEAALVAERERRPHCIGGVSSPPLEQAGSPQELSNLADAFTPQFVLRHI